MLPGNKPYRFFGEVLKLEALIGAVGMLPAKEDFCVEEMGDAAFDQIETFLHNNRAFSDVAGGFKNVCGF